MNKIEVEDIVPASRAFDFYKKRNGITKIEQEIDSTGLRFYAWKEDKFFGEISYKDIYQSIFDFQIGDRVRKRGDKGQWQGHVVGLYSTDITPVGYAIESEREVGSVQIYPQSALERIEK